MRSISVEVDGKTHSANYEIRGRSVVVWTARGMKSADTGASPPQVVARALLREMVEEQKRQ
jgi:hypothetical protein